MCNQNISKEKPCLYCKKLFTFKKKSAKFCCLRCQQLNMKSKKIVNEDGMVSCTICGLKANCLTSHITRMHNMSIEEYKTRYNSPIRSKKYLKEQSFRISGDKNPAYQHGGKFSALSDKFIYASTTDKSAVAAKISKANKENGNTSSTLLYWTKQGYTEAEAKEKLSERQTTFSLEICIQKYGKVEGTKKWNERQKKWLTNYKKTNFSKISQILFWEVFRGLKTKSDIYFATLLNGNEDKSGSNNEYVLMMEPKSIKPDFYHKPSKSIIEFDGDYWHGEKRGNKKRDADRDAILIKEGFRILHIRERDYKADPIKIVKDCVEFLNG